MEPHRTFGRSFDPVALAAESPSAEAFERAVLERLQRSVGFDVAFFATLGARPTTLGIDAGALEASLARADHASDLAPTKRIARSRRGVAVDTAVLGEHEVRKLGYFREFCVPIGGRHSLVALPTLRGDVVAGIVLGRCGSTFTDADVALVEDVLEPLAVARASYFVPWRSAPLRTAAPRSMLAALGDKLRKKRVLARVEDARGAIEIRDGDGAREMVATGPDGDFVWSRASIERPSRSGWFYVDLFHLAAARARERRNALFVGCGGGVVVRQFAEVYPGMSLDVVEPDARVVELARRWFDLDRVPRVNVAVDDGVSFVRRAEANRWDVVVVDAFEGSELAKGFADRSFFAEMRRVLRPGGGLAFNVVGTLAQGDVVQTVARAARAELDDVRLVPVLDRDEAYSPTALRNVVVLAFRRDR